MAPLCLACHFAPLSTNRFGLGQRLSYVIAPRCLSFSFSFSLQQTTGLTSYRLTFAGINSTFPETPSLPATKPVSAAGDAAGEADYMSSFGLTGIHRRSGVAIQRSWESQTPRHHGSVTDGFGPWTWQWPPFSESPLELRPRKSPTSPSCGFAS